MDIRPTHATLGAIVTHIDVRSLTADAFAKLEAAWHEHAVLIFPAQHLDDEAHIAFSRIRGARRGAAALARRQGRGA